ncbi:Asp23/Gls24 family envelope stress response protein [Proteinivorax tanatarense]|uniref:Asp23/Gls24 family envelope stress response protein n=1 Tax=Proteinivorax tanatarense TaxID=1260629 RepID=A0AAU7VQD7_9FIRM
MEQNTMPQENGSVKIADEVVAVIAGIAATDIEGVAGMSGGVAGGIAEMLGRKNLSKGVKVSVGETETTIDIYIIVDYGVKITEVSKNIQEQVKESVENMTGLNVLEVNIHAQGVKLENADSKEKEELKLN